MVGLALGKDHRKSGNVNSSAERREGLEAYKNRRDGRHFIYTLKINQYLKRALANSATFAAITNQTALNEEAQFFCRALYSSL